MAGGWWRLGVVIGDVIIMMFLVIMLVVVVVVVLDIVVVMVVVVVAAQVKTPPPKPGALAQRFGWLTDHVKAEVPPDIRERVVQLAAKSRKTWLGPPARAGFGIRSATTRRGAFS